MQGVKLEISWASLWRVVVIGLFVFMLYYLQDVVLTIFLSVFISAAISGTVLRMEGFKIPRIISTILIFAFALTFLAFIVYTIVPIAILELNLLLNNLDGTVGSILGAETTAKLKTLISPDLHRLANVLLAGGGNFLDVIGKLLGGVAYFFTVLIMSFYLTLSRDGVSKFIRALFPASAEEKAVHVYERTRRKIGRWFHTQLLLNLIMGVMVFTGLSILGVKYSLILAIIAGLMELIPVVGPIFAGTLTVMIAMTESGTLGLYVFIMFVVLQQFESNVLVPLMLKRAIDIHPVVVMVALLAGIKLAGAAGMILAIPATVLADELLDHWVKRKNTAKSVSVP